MAWTWWELLGRVGRVVGYLGLGVLVLAWSVWWDDVRRHDGGFPRFTPRGKPGGSGQRKGFRRRV